MVGCGRMQRGRRKMQDTSGVHIWLVLAKAFHALAAHAEKNLNLSGQASVTRISVSSKSFFTRTAAGQYDWSPSMAYAGIDQFAVDRLEKKALVKRKNTDDRRVRLVE